MRCTRALLLCLLCLPLTGCGLTLPRLRSPGFLHQQQLRATFHDPYAAVDVAPYVDEGTLTLIC